MNVGHKFVSAARVMAILLKISRIYSLFDNQSYNSLSTVSCLLETFPGIISITNDIRDGIRIISVSDREQVVTLNVAILLLTLIHGYRPVTVAAFAGTFALLVASLTTPTLLSKGAVMKLRVFASLAAACSKGPQIYLNWKRGRVGWLNGASAFLHLFQATLQLFTNFHDVEDLVILHFFTIEYLLNGGVATQAVFYHTADAQPLGWLR